MKKTLKIGEKDIELLSNARTSIYYSQLFHEDFYKTALPAFTNGEPALNEVKQLSFVMYKQAKNEDFKNISMDDFYKWLEDFEEIDMLTAMNEIIDVFIKNTEGTSESKK